MMRMVTMDMSLNLPSVALPFPCASAYPNRITPNPFAS